MGACIEWWPLMQKNKVIPVSVDDSSAMEIVLFTTDKSFRNRQWGRLFGLVLEMVANQQVWCGGRDACMEGYLPVFIDIGCFSNADPAIFLILFCSFFCCMELFLLEGHFVFSSPVLQGLTWMVLHSLPDAMPFWCRMGYAPADVCIDRRYVCKETQFMKKLLHVSRQNTLFWLPDDTTEWCLAKGGAVVKCICLVFDLDIPTRQKGIMPTYWTMLMPSCMHSNANASYHWTLSRDPLHAIRHSMRLILAISAQGNWFTTKPLIVVPIPILRRHICIPTHEGIHPLTSYLLPVACCWCILWSTVRLPPPFHRNSFVLFLNGCGNDCVWRIPSYSFTFCVQQLFA